MAAGVITDAAQAVLARRRMTWGQRADEWAGGTAEKRQARLDFRRVPATSAER